jgi:hypothetical protein
MDSLSLADMSTPKARHHKKPSKQFETPYEKIHRQVQQQYRIDSSDNSISRPTALDRYSAMENSHQTQDIDSPLSVKSLAHPPSTPSSTPRIPPPSTVKRHSPKKQGPLLHRVLDNNWRLQATPHRTSRNIYEDLDVLSSPPAPEITSQIFSPSPVSKLLKTPLTARKKLDEDSDSDFEQELGMSPPVTMQFSLPASKLIRTPARTAAMNIVEEVLRTAGAKDNSLDSIKTPLRTFGGGRKFSSNASEKEMWAAIRNAGTATGSAESSRRRKVDVDLDGSPFVQKTGSTEGMIGGVEDRSTLMTMARLANGDEGHSTLNDWQESEDWLQ